MIGGDERMKKILMIAAAAILSLAASPSVYAADFAPGEGMYLGAFVGHAAGHVSAKVEGTDYTGTACLESLTCTTSNTLEIKDGGLALNGVEGGGWIGYGYKMGDLYVGFEGDFAGGGGQFKITSSEALLTTNDGVTSADLSEVSAEMKWSGGASGRIGYYINDDTLFAIRAGISAAKFNAKFADESENFYGGGPAFGASVESRISAIDPNLSLKLAANYVDYLTAPISGIGSLDEDQDGGNNAEVSGAAYNARLGIVYSFFDVNSLF
jgi:opacity protein-like surface antigen